MSICVPEDEVESPDDEEEDGEAERDPHGHPEPRGDPVDVAVVLLTCRERTLTSWRWRQGC